MKALVKKDNLWYFGDKQLVAGKYQILYPNGEIDTDWIWYNPDIESDPYTVVLDMNTSLLQKHYFPQSGIKACQLC